MAVAGLLLTGGASARMGSPKAALVVDGVALAERAARLLLDVCDPVLEVGPGFTALPPVDEGEPHRGPLAALVAGADALGGPGPVLLLACDLPFVTVDLLRRMATWPGTGSVVPVDRDGRMQTACARYSVVALARAREALATGERALRRALPEGADISCFTPDDDRVLVDVDTPEDATRWGVERPGSLGS